MTQRTQTTPTPSPIHWQSLAQLAAIFIAIPAILLVFGFNLELTSLTAIQIGAALLTLLVVAWLIAGQRAPLPLRTPLLIWFAVYALAVAFSADPRRSFGQAVAMSIAVLIFALVADLTSRGWSVDLWAKALIFTGVVFLAIDYFAFILPWYQRWLAANPGDFLPDVFYRLPYSNHQIAIFYLTALVAVAYLFYTRSRPVRIFLAVYLAALVLPVYFTSSRGGWLGLIAGLGVMTLVGIFNGPPIIRTTWHKIRTTPVLIAPLVFFFVAGAAALLMYMVQLGQSPSHGGFLTSRSESWPPAWQAFLSDPLTGLGPHNYVMAYLHSESVPPRALFSHAHGLPFNLLAELGLLGFLAFAYLGISALRILYHRFTAAAGLTKAALWAALAALFAFGVHNLFDTLHQEPVALWTLLLILAPALANPQSSPGSQPPARRARPWLALAPLAFVWFYIYTITPYYTGIQAAAAGDLNAARAALIQAVERDPRAPAVHQQLALVDSVLAAGGDPDALPRAVISAERAAELDPDWALNWANLAALYRASGDLSAARAAINSAVDRAPSAGLLQLNLAVIAEEQGDLAVARTAYQSLLDANPAWLEKEFWAASPLRASLSPGPSVESDRPADYGNLIAWVKAHPDDSQAYLNLGCLAYQHGQLEDANHWIQTGLSTRVDSPEIDLELRWMEAELAAKNGDLAFAARQSLEVIETYFRYGAKGPGDLIQPNYNMLAFYLPSHPADFVPQFITPGLDPIWYQRAALASEWHRAIGMDVEASRLQKLANSAL